MADEFASFLQLDSDTDGMEWNGNAPSFIHDRQQQDLIEWNNFVTIPFPQVFLCLAGKS